VTHFDVLFYDLTSTYFEREAEEIEKAKRGYSRDHRPDCLQVIIALVITPEGFPVAYEVMDGNRSDRTTLRGFLDHIEKTYGQARRVWVMDRGIPTEALLAEMRDAAGPVFYPSDDGVEVNSQTLRRWMLEEGRVESGAQTADASPTPRSERAFWGNGTDGW
jgi:hypothetical protein